MFSLSSACAEYLNNTKWKVVILGGEWLKASNLIVMYVDITNSRRTKLDSIFEKLLQNMCETIFLYTGVICQFVKIVSDSTD